MSTRTSTRASTLVAWGIVGLTVGLWLTVCVLWLWIDAQHVPTPGRDSSDLLIVVCFAVLVYTVTGGVIASRRPDNPIGWIFIGSGLVVAFKTATGVYADLGHYIVALHPPLWQWSAWISDWIWIAAIGPYATFILLLYPTGSLPSRRWRAAAWLSVAAIACGALNGAFTPGHLMQFGYLANPLAPPAWARGIVAAFGAGFVLLPVSIALCVASLVVRARRGDAVVRAQIKWIAFAGAFLAIGFLDAGFITKNFTVLPAIFVFGPIAGVAVAAAIAIQRYRLFDIDRIISRTLSYAIVTATLFGTFAIIALVPTTVVGAGGHAPDWLVAVGTLAVAALFRPVQRRVQGAVDHRFNRKRYDAEHTVETFTSRLREQIDIDALGAELSAVIARALEPSHVTLWVAKRHS